MKRCPECRRDYYDDSLLYCLDDGTALLEGPASADEPATAILRAIELPSEAPTRQQIKKTNTATLPERADKIIPRPRRLDRRLFAAPVLLAVIVLGGFFGYRYFVPVNSNRIESIAVLPFVNTTADSNTEYLSDGISETLINSLTQIQQLRVAARTMTFRYKGKEIDPQTIGRELNVGALLTGNIRQTGDNLNVQVDLVDTATGAQIWGEEYERKIGDLLAIKQDIAREIIERLRVKISGAEQKKLAGADSTSAEAYQLYLRGRFYWNKTTAESLRKGAEYFQQAIDKDPNYAAAYSGLADCYALRAVSLTGGTLAPNEALPRAKAAALKALEIDDTLAEAHTSLAVIKLNYEWDWQGAEREFNRAINLNPNYDNAHHWYSHYLMAMGRTEESLAESKRALGLDPVGLLINLHLGWHYMNARQYDLAIEQFHKTLELDPNYGMAHWYLGQVYEQNAMYAEATAELRKAKDLLPENVAVSAELGLTYARSGKRDEAMKVIAELKRLSKERYVSAHHMTLIYAALGEKDQAFDLLENAFNERSDLLVYLKVDPRFDTLRSDPRFKELLRRVGLPE